MKTSFVQTEYSQPIGFTKEANSLNINFSNALNAYIGTSITISQKYQNENFRRFLRLKNQWKKETRLVSSGSVLINNGCYKNIIDMGSIAVPWIIRELRRSNDHWFFALEKITGVDPIKEENIGIIEKMKNDWIDWASNQF